MLNEICFTLGLRGLSSDIYANMKLLTSTLMEQDFTSPLGLRASLGFSVVIASKEAYRFEDSFDTRYRSGMNFEPRLKHICHLDTRTICLSTSSL